MPTTIAASLGSGVLALLFAGGLIYRVMREDEGPDGMRAIARAIQEGALAFLRREYTYLTAFVVIAAVVLGVFITPQTAAAYVLGAIGTDEAVGALVGLLGSGDWQDRGAAAKGLGFALQKNPAAREPLERALRDPDEFVRRKAEEGLAGRTKIEF